MYCSGCGSEIAGPDKYCQKCGIPIDTDHPKTPLQTKTDMSEPPRSLMIWIVLVGFALVGTYASLILTALSGQHSATHPQSGLGLLLWSTLFFYLIWRNQRKAGWKGALLGFLLGIIASAVAPVLEFRSTAAKQERLATEQMVDMMENLYAQTNQENPDGSPIEIKPNFRPKGDVTGHLALLQQWMADIVNDIAIMRNEYIADLTAVGLYKVFTSEHLISDPTFKKSWNIIANARSVVDKYEKRYPEIIERARSRIYNIDATAIDKQSMLDGFNRGVASSEAATKQLWELERLTIDEMEKTVSFLAANSNDWEIDNDQFLFSTDEQVDQFNKHMTAIEMLYNKQLELQKKALERWRNKIKEN